MQQVGEQQARDEGSRHQKEWRNGIDHTLHLTDSMFNKRQAFV
jgi:hypothetical protein